MKFYKVNNLLDFMGNPSYKGLVIEEFVPGSQVYAHDASECVIATNEDFQGQHADLTLLTQEQYQTEAQRIKDAYPPPPETQIQELQAQNAQMLLALVQGGLM
jgi:hypothetical protein